jgi:hypothetical protein
MMLERCGVALVLMGVWWMFGSSEIDQKTGGWPAFYYSKAKAKLKSAVPLEVARRTRCLAHLIGEKMPGTTDEP